MPRAVAAGAALRPLRGCLHIIADHGDGLADRHDCAGLGLDVQNARVFGFDLDVAFVRLDLRDHVADLDRLAVLLQPLKQGAFFHRVAHLRHDHFWHNCFLRRFRWPASS